MSRIVNEKEALLGELNPRSKISAISVLIVIGVVTSIVSVTLNSFTLYYVFSIGVVAPNGGLTSHSEQGKSATQVVFNISKSTNI